MIDLNKPKSVLSRPDEGQDFDIVERTISENKFSNSPKVYRLFRDNTIIGTVDFSDVIIDGSILGEDLVNVQKNFVNAALGIIMEHSDVQVGDGLYLNDDFLLEVNSDLIDRVKDLHNV